MTVFEDVQVLAGPEQPVYPPPPRHEETSSIPIGILEVSTFPQEIALGSLDTRRLILREPIRIRLSIVEANFVAEAPTLNEYGAGDTSYDAIHDLQRGIVDLFFSLKQDEEQLGADLRETLNRLLQHVEERGE